MMKFKMLAAALAFGLIAHAHAERPNIEPGLWETETNMTTEAPFPVPDQSDTTTDCITQDDLDEADTFLGDMDMGECDVLREEMRADGANYEMVCVEEGVTIEMVMDLQFFGDRSEGVITTQAETQMGPMSSTVEMTGRRIGDCD